MTRVKLLTFDITNTIIKVKRSTGLHYAKIARRHGIEANDELLLKSYREVWKTKNVEQPNFGREHGVTSWDWWRDIVGRTFIGAGYDIDPRKLLDIYSDLFEHYKKKDTWEVYERSHEVLTILKQEGLVLGVISNFDERLDTVLHSHDLLKYFDFVLTSVKIGCKKPDPRIFQMALELAKVQPHHGCHIGDDIEKDYQGARNVGMAAYLLHTSDDELKSIPDKRHILRDIYDLTFRIQAL